MRSSASLRGGDPGPRAHGVSFVISNTLLQLKNSDVVKHVGVAGWVGVVVCVHACAYLPFVYEKGSHSKEPSKEQVTVASREAHLTKFSGTGTTRNYVCISPNLGMQHCSPFFGCTELLLSGIHSALHYITGRANNSLLS